MPSGKEAQRAARRREEVAEIGLKDSERLHKGMNKSRASEEKRAHKQRNLSSGRRNGSPEGPISRSLTSTSGHKRHAAAGAGPSEPTPTRAAKRSGRATSR